MWYVVNALKQKFFVPHKNWDFQSIGDTKLRDWDVRPARDSYYSWTASNILRFVKGISSINVILEFCASLDLVTIIFDLSKVTRCMRSKKNCRAGTILRRGEM